MREAALTALETRRRTRAELEAILRRKGFSSADVGLVLDRLSEVGLIDDLEYARVYLERRVAARPRGARLLKAELLARGVPAALAEKAIDERKAEADPAEDALRALKPWLARNRGQEARLLKPKIWQFLARRGFSADVIEEAVARLEPAAGDGDDD